MSYDMRLVDPHTGTVARSEGLAHTFGGTIVVGGSDELSMNITYNYWPHYHRLLNKEKGIRAIYGLTGAEAIRLLLPVIAVLGNDIDEDYWKPTEGNAREALIQLVRLSLLAPDAVWEGD